MNCCHVHAKTFYASRFRDFKISNRCLVEVDEWERLNPPQKKQKQLPTLLHIWTLWLTLVYSNCAVVWTLTLHRWTWIWVKLTYSSKGDVLVFPRVNGIVIRPVSPHVSSAVDQPSGVQHQGVPQHGRDEVGYPQRLPPHVPWHKRGNKEAHEQHGLFVIPAKETKKHHCHWK